MGKRSARREEARRKLNIIKLTVAIFVVFFAAMSIWLISINIDNNKEDENNTSVNEIEYFDEDVVKEVEKEKEKHILDLPYDYEVPSYQVELEKAKSLNEDTVGWLIVNNTNINYPVVQTTDNDYYLHLLNDNDYQ